MDRSEYLAAWDREDSHALRDRHQREIHGHEGASEGVWDLLSILKKREEELVDVADELTIENENLSEQNEQLEEEKTMLRRTLDKVQNEYNVFVKEHAKIELEISKIGKSTNELITIQGEQNLKIANDILKLKRIGVDEDGKRLTVEEQIKKIKELMCSLFMCMKVKNLV